MSRDIMINLIDADPEQPRRCFDAGKLRELASSMAANGLLIPIMVRPDGSRFYIVHGERRYRAAKALGWESIPADVREVDSDTAQWFALVENVQRADLSPIEEAKAYRSRLEHGITQAALGERIGKTQSYIAQKLRLLKLPDSVQVAIEQGSITEGHARQLLKVSDDATIERYCEMAIVQGLSVKALKKLIDNQAHLESIEKYIDGKLDNLDKAFAEIPASEMFAPSDFHQLLQKELSDTEILELLTTLYAIRYYTPRLAELETRLDDARDIAELTDIALQADEAQRELMERNLQLAREAGRLLQKIDA